MCDTYVTDADGTGIVHQAPAFGEDDHRIAIANGIITAEEMPPCPIDDAGYFTDEVPDYAGEFIKVRGMLLAVELADFPKTADSKIQKAIKAKGRLIVQSTLNHSYPFCWR